MWHPEVITEAVEQTLLALQRVSALTNFTLAGGTGLALDLGHRRSIDLDLFTSGLLETEVILGKLEKLHGLQISARDAETLHVNIGETKVSFLAYRYPVLFPCQAFMDVEVFDPRDIGCMKVSAIAGRGAKRDFIDLCALSQHYELGQILTWFKEKYARANYSMVHVMKSLTYFEESEQDPMPDMLINLTWDDVKQFFIKEVPRLLA
jgi:hypothetical protein